MASVAPRHKKRQASIFGMLSEAGPNDFYWQLGRWLLISVLVVPLGLLSMALSPTGVLLLLMVFSPFLAVVGGIVALSPFGVLVFLSVFSPFLAVVSGTVVGACLGWLVGAVHQRWVGRSVLIWTIIGFALGFIELPAFGLPTY